MCMSGASVGNIHVALLEEINLGAEAGLCIMGMYACKVCLAHVGACSVESLQATLGAE